MSNPLEFFKSLKYPIINFIVQEANKCSISNKVLGNYLRAFHLSAPFNMILLSFFLPKNLFIIMYLMLCCALFCFILWDGCFITRVEKILVGDDITFIDPCLELIKIPLTNANRMNASILAAFFYMINMTLIFIFRFFLNFSINLTKAN